MTKYEWDYTKAYVKIVYPGCLWLPPLFLLGLWKVWDLIVLLIRTINV